MPEIKLEGSLSDEILIERIKQGNISAFNQLINKYKKKAYYLACDLVSNHQDAEDLSQEAFIKVYKNIKTFKGESSFQTWFYKIIVNLCRSHLRHRYLVDKHTYQFREPVEELEETEQSIETSVADQHWESSPLQATINEELNQAINQAIQSLPAQQKEVFILKHYQGLKIKEIAQIVNCAEGTVKAHLFRAVQHLQEKLKKLSLNYKEGGLDEM